MASKPAFEMLPRLKSATLVENWGIAIILMAGVFIGVSILRGNPDGKNIAKLYLKGRLAGSIIIQIISFIIIYPLLMRSDLPSEWKRDLTAHIFKVIIYEAILFLIWWFYFKKSKRVRDTYDL
jgi:hypothetical protein